ncbi:MAG: cyclase family protein [Saprospiraceae bacterium]|nr:cyclase family protein [Saprospiraceae bacterium]
MKADIHINNKSYRIDFSKGLDISIPYTANENQVNCFYAPYFRQEPVTMGNFIGSVELGGPVNFTNVFLNVHGNGTHTECVGHIRKEFQKVNNIFTKNLFTCTVISIYPTKIEEGGLRIEKETLEQFLQDFKSEALCIRTLPNDALKKNRKYSGTNPAYISSEGMQYLTELNVQHLLVDIPSVDREQDGGLLAAHNIFWQNTREKNCSITELIFIPEEIKDGEYLIQIQIPSIELDAVPSKPVLYAIEQ